MKRIVFYACLFLLTLISLSCSLIPVISDKDEPQLSTGTPTAVMNPSQEPTDSPIAGFITGTPIDVLTLPNLNVVGGGAEPVSCYTGTSEPSINLGYGLFPYQTLCLNNFPIAPDSPGIAITLVDPTARSFSESFTYSQDGMINSRGEKAGYIENGSGIDGNEATPGVSIELYLPASFSCGEWTGFVTTQDSSINVGPTILPMECDVPRMSVLTDVSSNPFVSPEYSWDGPIFRDNETIYVVGTAYTPNTAITVAFYQQDNPGGTPESGLVVGNAIYATTLMTDASGNFQTAFVVGSETQRGAYYVIAAPEITPDMRLFSMGVRFSIE
jgi:hypothetical protein